MNGPDCIDGFGGPIPGPDTIGSFIPHGSYGGSGAAFGGLAIPLIFFAIVVVG
jgi:hypothetical protein